MFRLLVTLMAAAAVAACAQNMIATNYLKNQPTVVPAAFEPLKISELIGYESAKYPGKLYVAPNSERRWEIAMSGRSSQWSAMLPTIEPAYRDAALRILAQRGHADCVIDSHVPLPKEYGIEYAYRCAS